MTLHFIDFSALKNPGPDRDALILSLRNALSDLLELGAARMCVQVYFARIQPNGVTDTPARLRPFTVPAGESADPAAIADRALQVIAQGVGEGFRGRIRVVCLDGAESVGATELPGAFDRLIEIPGAANAIGWGGDGGGMAQLPGPQGQIWGSPSTLDAVEQEDVEGHWDPTGVVSSEQRAFFDSIAAANERRLDGERQHTRELVNANLALVDRFAQLAEHQMTVANRQMEIATQILQRSTDAQKTIKTGHPVTDVLVNAADRWLGKQQEVKPLPAPPRERPAPNVPQYQEDAWQPPPEPDFGDFADQNEEPAGGAGGDTHEARIDPSHQLI